MISLVQTHFFLGRLRRSTQEQVHPLRIGWHGDTNGVVRSESLNRAQSTEGWPCVSHCVLARMATRTFHPSTSCIVRRYVHRRLFSHVLHPWASFLFLSDSRRNAPVVFFSTHGRHEGSMSRITTDRRWMVWVCHRTLRH